MKGRVITCNTYSITRIALCPWLVRLTPSSESSAADSPASKSSQGRERRMGADPGYVA